MSNLLIGGTLADDATITTGSEASEMEASRLLTQQPSEKWRATDLNNSYVVLDLGSAMEVGLIALLYTNLSTDATWQVRGATSEANLTAAPGYDSGSVGAWPEAGLGDWDYTHAVLWLGSSPETFQWWRVDVSDTGNAAGYVQAGRLYLSSPWQLVINVQYGWGQRFDDRSRHSVTAGGQHYAVVRPRKRLLSMPFEFGTEAEMQNLLDIQRLAGTTGDRLVVFDPDNLNHDKIWYGRFREYGLITQPEFQFWAANARFEEML